MRKKLLTSFIIVLIIGISITGLFSIKLTQDLYLSSLEEKLVSNGKLLSSMFSLEYIPGNTYNEAAIDYSKISNARVTIIAGDGKVIGESSSDSSLMENHIERQEIKEALSGRIGIESRYSSTNKINMLYVAIPMESGVTPKAVIRLSIPLTDIQKIQSQYFNYIIMSVLIGIIFASVIAYVLVENITKPFNELTYISSQIAKGNYDRRIKLDSKDEAGQFADVFNNMAEKLEITISDLSDKKNKLEAILKSMQNGVIAVDNIGKIMLVNPAALYIFQLKENILGKHILEVFRNIELEDIIYKHEDSNKEIKLNYPEKKVLRVKATPIKDVNEAKKNMGVVVVIQDITELRQLEQIRSDFVANVSHELKTPLTSIKGFAETLKGGAINDEVTREKFLDIINVEADRLTRLINDILSISELENKKQNIQLERVNFNEEINETHNMFLSLSKLKDINLILKKDENIPGVMGNRDKVKQLLINLIDNAIKYTPKGGTVTVKTYFRDNLVCIDVADTGIGIQKEHIPRLFERFYRVDKGRSRALGGTGLGLAIVKHIVASMNGSITVESEPGIGTVFTIMIPPA